MRIGRVLDKESGLRADDVVLDIQGKAVSGMTRSDVNDWLRMCAARGGVVSFRLVEAGAHHFLISLVRSPSPLSDAPKTLVRRHGL